MAKPKKNHVLIGKILTVKGQVYRVQDIQGKVVYASKMIDEKTCQRGRPSKFDLSEVLTILGMSMQALEAEVVEAAKPVVKAKPKPEEIVEEEPVAPAPVGKVSTEVQEERKKSLAAMLALFPGNETTGDW